MSISDSQLKSYLNMPVMPRTSFVTQQSADHNRQYLSEPQPQPNVSALLPGELPLMKEAPANSSQLHHPFNARDVTKMFSVWCGSRVMTTHDGFDVSIGRSMFCVRRLHGCLPNRPRYYNGERYLSSNFSQSKPSKISRERSQTRSIALEVLGKQTTNSSYGFEYVENRKYAVKKKAIRVCLQSDASKEDLWLSTSKIADSQRQFRRCKSFVTDSQKNSIQRKNLFNSINILLNDSSSNQKALPQRSLPETIYASSSSLKDELDLFELPQNVPISKGVTCCQSNHLKPFSHNTPTEHTEHKPMPPLDLDALPLSECFGFPSRNRPVGHVHQVQSESCTMKESNRSSTPHRSLSQKYRPKLFEDLIGQDFVIRSLLEDIRKEHIAPVYLFQGSRGTGKTSVARIFAAYLNCDNEQDKRPCGSCKECQSFTRGENIDIKEVDAASYNDIVKLKASLHSMLSPVHSKYKVYIVEECHMLEEETWTALLNFLNEPIENVVFIFVTTDPGKLPTIAVSSCRRMSFGQITEAEILARLQFLAKLENLDIETGVLDVIARKSDGSLRDAEIILDQLSLFDQRITFSKFYGLFGSVAEEKLQDLLYYALCSDTVHTIQMARELIDSGVEPLDLTGQLATLIREFDMERLQLALQVLSDAENHLKEVTSDRTTWLTAALLQFGPALSHVVKRLSPDRNSPRTKCDVKRPNSESSNKRKYKVDQSSILKGEKLYSGERNKVWAGKADYVKNKSKSNSVAICMDDWFAIDYSYPIKSVKKKPNLFGIGGLESVWLDVLEVCKSFPLKQLLQHHGCLAAISISADEATVVLEFQNPQHKYRTEQHRVCITHSFEIVLGIPVDVKITLSARYLNSSIPESAYTYRHTNSTEQNDHNEHIDKTNSGLNCNSIRNNVTVLSTKHQLYDPRGAKFGEEESSSFNNLETDELLLKPHSNYGGVLCWKATQEDGEMASKNKYYQRVLTKLVPCVHV